MAKVIIFERVDGGVGVVHLTPEKIAQFGGDETAALSSIRSKVVPGNAISSEIVDQTVLPSDRIFRDAWKKVAATITVNMPEARVIHMDRIRIVRDAKLLDEDKNWNKAADQAAKDIIEARRATLRDIPNSGTTADAVVAATTPAILDAVWPTADLGARV